MFQCKTTVGSYLVVHITGYTGSYIAEVVEEDPLRLKVEESGWRSNLKDGDYIIIEDLSARIQDEVESTLVLKEYADRGYPLISGLKSLDVPQDGKLYTILPRPEVRE